MDAGLDFHSLYIEFAVFILGVLAALIGNYFAFMKQIAFIRGQLSLLVEAHTETKELAEKHLILEGRFTNAVDELQSTIRRLKYLESQLLNGSSP